MHFGVCASGCFVAGYTITKLSRVEQARLRKLRRNQMTQDYDQVRCELETPASCLSSKPSHTCDWACLQRNKVT
ncbi:hypothetical protein VCR15J2_20798 [Vibrio coralliirubri]|nr:hypothetical protein VCR15J2_20798 [Vibrio coralliirubri]